MNPREFTSTQVAVPLAASARMYLDLGAFADRERKAIDEAYAFATFWHGGQRRKGTERPYFVHPLTVARILAERGASADLIAAALLHDVLEDTPVLPCEIRDRFGARVCDLVVAVTRSKWRPWRLPPDRDAALLKAADLACNLADTTLGLEQQGRAVWARFAMGRRKVQRWNESLRQVEAVLGDDPLAAACRDMLDRLTEAAARR